MSLAGLGAAKRLFLVGLQWQKQGDDECALAVLAMLTDTPLSVVRTLALKNINAPSWYANVKGFSSTITNLCFISGLPDLTAPYNQNLPSSQAAMGLAGRGQIYILWVGTAHVVAYEDGIIYDSGYEGPMPLQTWLDKCEERHGEYIRLVVTPIK
mgnify:FL=1